MSISSTGLHTIHGFTSSLNDIDVFPFDLWMFYADVCFPIGKFELVDLRHAALTEVLGKAGSHVLARGSDDDYSVLV